MTSFVYGLRKRTYISVIESMKGPQTGANDWRLFTEKFVGQPNSTIWRSSESFLRVDTNAFCQMSWRFCLAHETYLCFLNENEPPVASTRRWCRCPSSLVCLRSPSGGLSSSLRWLKLSPRRRRAMRFAPGTRR